MSILFYLSYGTMWVLLLVVGVLILLLYRHFGLITLGTEEGVQRDGLPVGAVAPPLRSVTVEGAATEWRPRSGRPELVLFATPDCAPCATILPAVGRLARHNFNLGITAVVPGGHEGIIRFIEKFHPPFPCIADGGREAFDGYRVRVTPFAFVVSPDGRIRAKGLCSDPSRLRALLTTGGLHEAAALVVPMAARAREEAGIAVGVREA